MRAELDVELCNKYPRIFRDRHADMRVTAMCWGFECGDGWFNILDAACGQIQQHIDWTRNNRARALRYNRALARALGGDLGGLRHFRSLGMSESASNWREQMVQSDIARATPLEVPEACTQVVAVQVKEKFGGLRFYTNGGDSVVDGILRMAESMSYRTCEVCGSPGKVYRDGWHVALCPVHAAEQGRVDTDSKEEENEE